MTLADWLAGMWRRIGREPGPAAAGPPARQSYAALADASEWTGAGSTFPPSALTYAALYRTQPAIRTVVGFLADNVAQVPVHLFLRAGDTDRVRITAADHPVARTLAAPNGGTTAYRFMRDLVSDLAIFGNAYHLKLAHADDTLELVRLAPTTVSPVGAIVPVGYRWTPTAGVAPRRLRPADVLHLRFYDPEGGAAGLSPLETLRQTLAEESAAMTARAAQWRNAARMAGFFRRPAEAPVWTPDQRSQFVEDLKRYKPGGDVEGGTPVLEDGMEFLPTAATAQQSQYIESRKLNREEAAALYHVPPAMLGMLEAQGYGSVREQHRVLYQDTLGPWFAMIEDDLELQLLRDYPDDDIYAEFNVSEKLQGSFDEQSTALGRATGAAWMTRNEARARMNLPRVPDPAFDRPVTRLDIAGAGAGGPDAAPE